MSNLVHLLEPRLLEAATALANRRRPDPRPDILQVLPEETFERVVEDARTVLEAAANVDAAPRPRSAGELRITDAGALGLDLGAKAIVILALGADSRVSGAIWARGLFQHLHVGTPALAHLWSAATHTLHSAPGARAGSSPSKVPEQL